MVSVTQLFSDALRDTEIWTFRSTVKFEENRPTIESMRAYKLGDVEDQFVEREEVEISAVRCFNAVKVGVVSRLVAGTGSGKSTRVPLAISSGVGCVGIVLCPTHLMASSISSYVVANLLNGKYSRCRVQLVSSYAEFKRVLKPAVIYMGVNEFLTMFSAHVDLFTLHVIGYLFIDESHERLPAYSVLRLLVSTKLFKNTKVFMGTATISNHDMEFRKRGAKHVVKPIKPSLLMYDDCDAMDSLSPMHHTSIHDRTMIFVPSVKEFASLQSYYESNAVMVRLVKPGITNSELINLNEFLNDVAHAVVVIATPSHQTGYTFVVDTVIDCGVTEYLTIDVEAQMIHKDVRIETGFEATQRCGRVGRHLDGVAYCPDVEHSSDDFELYSASDVYVALWCKIFNVEVSLDYLRKWKVFMSNINIKCAQILLCARIHPCLLVNYLDAYGMSYAGTRHVFGKITGKTEVVLSSGKRLPGHAVENWLPKRLKIDGVDIYTEDFYVPCELPVEWLPIACVLYHGLSGKSITSLLDEGQIVVKDVKDYADNNSVISFAISASSVAKSDVSRGIGDRRSTKQDVRPDDSVSMRIISENVNTDLPTYSSANVERFAHDMASRMGIIDNLSVPVVDHGHHILETKKSGSKHRRRRSSKSDEIVSASSSANSDGKVRAVAEATVSSKRNDRLSRDYNQQKLKVTSGDVRVDAANLSRQRIKPEDAYMMSRFANLRADEQQRRLYEDLKYCRLEIATLLKTDMDSYFLATVLTWNRTVSNYYQFKAAPYTGILSDLRNSAKIADYNKVLDVCRGFLMTFQHHGYRLLKQTGVEQCGQLLPSAVLARAERSARYAISVGSKQIEDFVALAASCVYIIRNGDGTVSHYYVDGDKLFFIKHAFRATTTDLAMTNLPRQDLVGVYEADFRLFSGKLSTRAQSLVNYRTPVDCEMVLVIAYLDKLTPSVFGVYKVRYNESNWYYNAKLSDGMSGAAVVALIDGAVIGFHDSYFQYNIGDLQSMFVAVTGN